MSKGPQASETCRKVYELLEADGLAVTTPVDVTRWGAGRRANAPGVKKEKRVVSVVGYKLTPAGEALVSLAKVQQGRLLNGILRDNDKLVRKLVNQLFKQTASFTEEEDLYQEGLLAFVKALETFDPDAFSRKGVGASFPTFVRAWIRDYVQRGTTRQQPIKHPRGFGMPYEVYRKAEDILAKTGTIATAAQLGSYKLRGKMVPVTEELLIKWRTSSSLVVPLDELHNVATKKSWDTGANNEFIEIGTAADSTRNPETLYEREEQQVHINRLISGLTSQEKTVLEMMREGDASNRKVAGVLGCKDECARLFKIALIEKIRSRAERTA